MTARRMIDARGAFCPQPLMELVAAITHAAVGDEFEVLSSDKGSTNDIPTWARKCGHELLGMEEAEGYWSIRVRKTH